MSEQMKEWYFEDGGILLTSVSVKEYHRLQEHLARYYEQEKDDSKLVGTPDYQTITALCTNLRTVLTRDLLSRRRLFSR